MKLMSNSNVHVAMTIITIVRILNVLLWGIVSIVEKCDQIEINQNIRVSDCLSICSNLLLSRINLTQLKIKIY